MMMRVDDVFFWYFSGDSSQETENSMIFFFLGGEGVSCWMLDGAYLMLLVVVCVFGIMIIYVTCFPNTGFIDSSIYLALNSCKSWWIIVWILFKNFPSLPISKDQSSHRRLFPWFASRCGQWSRNGWLGHHESPWEFLLLEKFEALKNGWLKIGNLLLVGGHVLHAISSAILFMVMMPIQMRSCSRAGPVCLFFFILDSCLIYNGSPVVAVMIEDKSCRLVICFVLHHFLGQNLGSP